MKYKTRKTLEIYWQHTKAYSWWVWLVIFAAVGATLLQVAIPIQYKRFFDILSVGETTNQAYDELVYVLILIAIMSVAQWFLWRITTFVSSYYQSHVMTNLVNYCFEYLHKHSHDFFNNSFVGSLVKKVKWFGKAFESIADRFTWDFLPLVVTIITITTVIAWRSIFLALIMVVWVILFLALNLAFTKYKLRYDLQRSAAETETTAVLADTITNHSTVKFFGGYIREVISFNQVNESLRRLRLFTWNLGNSMEAFQAFLMIALEIGIMYIAIGMWRDGILTVGDFVMIQAYMINLFMKVWHFGRIIRDIYENLSDAEEMTEILLTPHEIKDIPNAKELAVSDARIVFDQVDFYYHQTRAVLQKFNFEINPRQHVALIGPSGAGKSTIVKLMLRITDVSAGHIKIDGQDISQVTQESLWQAISYVPQDPILFHRTLMENIRYGRPEATDQEVIEASKLANCHEFISRLPEGYESFVGERGVKLSGGERQRVAIARAILRNSPILILDEATSSLDSESEGLIQEALDILMKGKTVVVIAHRLSTIRKMDRIVVVDNGKIVESGSHQDLLNKKDGLYQRLWQLQAGGFVHE